ncbi:unnamed protein product [Adineta steineri]|uniref:DUF6570 domain-containing protein n=1 Tax=Adineta steineri TaxID=433720 RepID=A0A820BYI2_9BILA|nr:unnamed protein product [Adineta steineri]
MKERRANDEFRLLDNRRRAKSHKAERQNNEFKTQENERRAKALKIEPQNDEFKTQDNKRRAEAHKIERQNGEFKEEERRRNALRMYNSRDKYKNNFDAMKSNYESNIKEGPTHICSCCGGLWFAYSIREYTIDMLANKGLKTEFINTVCYLKHAIIKLCATCRKDIMSNKIPNIALSNGLAFCEIPDCLKILTELEERLISPRIPFMVIRTLGFSKQFGLKVVHTAVKYLVQQELYKDEGIVISNDWIKEYLNEKENFIVKNEDKKFNETENTGEYSDHDDNWNESDDKPINPVTTETLLNDETEDQNDIGIKFALGENNRPISVLMDLKVDELTFPKIYCGKQRKIKENVKLTYAKIAKSELRMFDRRCVHNDGAFAFLRFDRAPPAFWELKKKELMAMNRQLECATIFLTL